MAMQELEEWMEMIVEESQELVSFYVIDDNNNRYPVSDVLLTRKKVRSKRTIIPYAYIKAVEMYDILNDSTLLMWEKPLSTN